MLTFDSVKFAKEMNNIVQYSLGYMEGIQRGKKVFLQNLGNSTIELMKKFVDSNARLDPDALQHMYEWHETGSPSARLFDISYTTSNLGLSFRSTFRQSSSVKNGSYTPFYDKARIMEYGIPVTIKPKESKVLVFNDNGETVFTQKPVTIDKPGGRSAAGSFEKTLDSFMTLYFTQAFLNSSGIMKYFSDSTLFKRNISAGARLGKSKGIDTGYRWIANAAVMEDA